MRKSQLSNAFAQFISPVVVGVDIFRTLPKDSTGVCHIIEHSLLCGSKKYPVKEPFVNLLKTSLATFLNAFTAYDWTMYPFASQTPKDFDIVTDATPSKIKKILTNNYYSNNKQDY